MRLVLENSGTEHEFEVVAGPDATVGDLAASLMPDEPLVLHQGLLELDPRVPLREAGLASGGVLTTAPSEQSRPAVAEFRILAGPGAGHRLRLPVGRYVVGSGLGASIVVRAPGVRPQHARLDVAADGSAMLRVNGNAVGSPITTSTIVRLGSCLVGCVPVSPDEGAGSVMPGRRGTISHNRPPRRRADAHPVPIPLPEAPTPPRSRARLSLVAMIAPLVFGIAMAILIHPRMAMFALLGPIMMLGNWADDKRRARKFRRDAAAETADEVDRLHTRLDRAMAAEVALRHAQYPSVAVLAGWARGATRLWERRAVHPDFLELCLGYGRPSWRPPLAASPLLAADELQTVLAARGTLPLSPVPMDLSVGQVLGVAGDPAAALEVAYGLVCQAATLHGPADVQIAVVTSRPEMWAWAKWLPHTIADAASGRRLLASTAEEIAGVVGLLMPPSPPAAPSRMLATPAATPDGEEPATLLIVDVPSLANAEMAGLRQLLGGRGQPVAGLVLAAVPTSLPSVCTEVLHVSPSRAVLEGSAHDGLVLQTASATFAVASEVARSLARYDDPERREDGAELPAGVALLDLLEMVNPHPADIVKRWRRAAPDFHPMGPIGVSEAGPLVIDIVTDGPHGLLAGTTGSGKSELLRTLVASLAASVDPEHLSFVLIDYKGGSAFDACAGLPHTVGMVTDLDDQLAERALRCLEAELRYREHLLREAGADDLPAYLALGLDEPLPRMLIVIDEFAAMAKELPDFMDALVDIAARGRSLGVHLVLATQRPAGVIRDNVRANTNLRIALRVQDRADSQDVLGDSRAAAVGRSQPGRGYARFGPTELVPFQTALVTGASAGSGAGPRVELRPVPFAMEPPEPNRRPGPDTATTDLERLVAAIAQAAPLAGMRQARRPWPEPLPALVALAELDVAEPPSRTSIPVGLVDEPDQQRQRTLWWDAAGGSLGLFGLTGAGTTTTMATLAVGMAERHDPADLHMYVLDFDAGGLAPLRELPHVGAYVAAADRERQVRLIRQLTAELETRKATGLHRGRDVRIVLLLDNYSGFAQAFEAGHDAPLKDALHRIITDGAELGIVSVVSAARANAIPSAVAGSIPGKLLFRLVDPMAGTMLGVRRPLHGLRNGQAIHAASARELQVAVPHSQGLAEAVAVLAGPPPARGGAPPVEELPSVVKSSDVADELRIVGDDWFLPIGIGDHELRPVGLRLGPGDHVLVAGEPRGGKSTLLCALGSMVKAGREDVTVTCIATRRSPLRDLAEADEIVTEPGAVDEALTVVLDANGPQLVLIDDCDDLEATPALKEVIAVRRPEIHVVAAGRRDLKTQYNHWAKDMGKSRVGVWLKPSPGLDGDLWSTPMPRRVPPGMPPGRGFLVAEGTVELVQTVAH